MIGALDDAESMIDPIAGQIGGSIRIAELIVLGRKDQLGSGVARGEHRARTRQWWCDPDPAENPRLDNVESDHRTERISDDPDAFVVKVREEVDRRRHVESFGFATIVLTFAASDTTKIEPDRIETSFGESSEESVDHRIEAVAPYSG